MLTNNLIQIFFLAGRTNLGAIQFLFYISFQKNWLFTFGSVYSSKNSNKTTVKKDFQKNITKLVMLHFHFFPNVINEINKLS